MKDLTSRISRLTHELRALRLQLQWDSFQDTTPKDKDSFVDQVVSTGLVSDLKEVVDEMNQFLWSYIDSAARNSGPDVDYALQSARLNEVTDMLRLLRQSSCPTSGAQLEFVARVTIAVDRQLQEPEEHETAVRRSA
jgi:hypothetical protein